MKQFKEQELVARLQNPATQRRAFEEMVGHFSESLYWQIRRMVTYHDDADDVLPKCDIHEGTLSGFNFNFLTIILFIFILA